MGLNNIRVTLILFLRLVKSRIFRQNPPDEGILNARIKVIVEKSTLKLHCMVAF